MIRTLAVRADAFFRVKNSRFHASAFPADSEEEAREGIAAAERQDPGATHHCHAYRIGSGDAAVERTSDAGEPAGSAGAPILSAIKGKGLTNVAVVVSRHFGGTKLGLGGLSRAYRNAARAALDSGEILERPARCRLTLTLPVALAGEARALLARLGGHLRSERYGGAADLQVVIGEDRRSEFRSSLEDLTRGAVHWSDGEPTDPS